ncbi:MAG: riboflavin synthase [Candidatus Magasanikbacteria bacterium]|nr:riboflavin synthase [Candidatus Magasanikbacteria bacterium]
MFTGIIQATARVQKNDKQKDGGSRLSTAKPLGWRVKKGESIAVNGVCLTTVSVGSAGSALAFVYMPETALRSTIESLKVGEIVNLEQAMQLGDRLNGHMVQGHVDTVGTISALKKDGNSYALKITPREVGVLRWIVEKGSVAVDGISLTVVMVAKRWFMVKIIPHTWQETNLYTKKAGDRVNIEADILAKYIEKLYANKK